METPTRNGPCPCGSGVKYKKCCLPKQPQEPERPRIVEHRGQRMIASSPRGGTMRCTTASNSSSLTSPKYRPSGLVALRSCRRRLHSSAGTSRTCSRWSALAASERRHVASVVANPGSMVPDAAGGCVDVEAGQVRRAAARGASGEDRRLSSELPRLTAGVLSATVERWVRVSRVQGRRRVFRRVAAIPGRERPPRASAVWRISARSAAASAATAPSASAASGSGVERASAGWPWCAPRWW